MNENNQPDFANEITQFIKHIESQADIVPLILGLLRLKLIQESKHVNTYIKENGIEEKSDSENSKRYLKISEDKIKGFIELSEKVDTSNLAYKLMPINFVVSFVSQYDAYLGGLIRNMFKAKPELLNSSEKNILFTELLEFNSIQEATEFIIDKEVESVLREAHLKQFKWLEQKLGITLRNDLSSFSHFIEITERRNLFVHNNGIISRQYIEVCKENKVDKIEKVKLGQKLNADSAYYIKVYRVLFEIGVKLGQVIWRKLIPEEIEKADAHLNAVCYQLLIKGNFKLALNLLTFATDILKKHHDNEIICIFTINKALAYYLSDKKEDCLNGLKKQDWSATNDKFKLAIAVLNENHDEAIKIMETIGSNNSHLNKDAYREWPLFKDFRKKEGFKKTYKKMFNEEFVYLEKIPRSLEDILDEIKQAKKEAQLQKAEADTSLPKAEVNDNNK